MATLTITIPDAQLPRVLKGLCPRWGYTGFLPDGITPVSQQEFVRRSLIKYIINELSDQEARIASGSSYNNSISDVKMNITIT